MSARRPSIPRPPSPAGGLASVATAIVLSTVYCAAFFIGPRPFWPAILREAMSYPSRWVYRLIDTAFRLSGTESAHIEVLRGVYLVLMAGVVPWLVMALTGRGRPFDLGFRRPNRFGWRIAVVGYLIAAPFLVWMVRGAGFAGPYLEQLERAGATVFILYYLANMLTEHFFLHGLVLAACRANRRWPPPLPVECGIGLPECGTGLPECGRAAGFSPRGRARDFRSTLRWLGLAQPTGDTGGLRRITRWLGLAGGCVPAIVTSTMLFGLVHIGKDPRELVLSVPGGVALAYVAYRTNTWLIPFLLHVATAGTALAMIVVMN
ncbi:MAG: CPBP family intramembrane glutamic endopeptidase [Phycisphaerae bacterium]